MSWVNKYMNIHFKDKGRDWSGVDCWGLLCLIYWHEKNILLPSYAHDYRSANRDQKNISKLIFEEIGKHWIETNKPEPFDSISLRFAGRPWHCGVMVDNKNFLHIEKETIYPVITRTTNLNWRNKIIGYYKYVG